MARKSLEPLEKSSWEASNFWHVPAVLRDSLPANIAQKRGNFALELEQR